ncbi:MAG: hypothetical protein MJ106_05660 [Lentisphaeria bacterium]|nr:hypothetical protein [Lentisphaeria bacterium]
MTPFCIFAIVDAIIAAIMYFGGMEFKLAFCIMAGMIVAEIVARVTFHFFFQSLDDYGEAWRYRCKWDIFSLIDGELWDDMKASFILWAYHTLALLAGIGVFCLVDKLL